MSSRLLEVGIARANQRSLQPLHRGGGVRKRRRRVAPWRQPSDAPRELADAQAARPQAGPNSPEALRGPRHSGRGAHRAGAVGADHFVVSEIHDEEIGIVTGGLSQDGQHDVGIHGGYRGIHDLEANLRIALVQKHPEHAGKTVLGHEVAEGGRSPEHEDAVAVSRLLAAEVGGNGSDGRVAREETFGEIQIRRIRVSTFDLRKKSGSRSHAADAQRAFEQCEEAQRREHRQRSHRQPVVSTRLRQR
jgi:hypothetical protein